MKCNIAKDLLPLYFDGLCSEETKKQLEEHMEQCETCSQLKEDLESEQCIESEQDWPPEKEQWDKAIAPLKKVKKKIRRKNILIAVCIFFLLLFLGGTSVLTYGQIAKKGISFELLYDAVRFGNIGKQFASGNIEPLYENLYTGYLLQDAESSVLRLAYADHETYDSDMKEAILEKYHQYFDGKNLTYKGIEEISYLESAKTGWERTLFIALKFEGEEQAEYYITLYKTLDGKYLADDYFGNPYFFYTSGGEEKAAESEMDEYEVAESYHTDDTLFSCLPNQLTDVDLHILRQVVLELGKRALEGDRTLVENGQMRFSIVSEQDLQDGTESLREDANHKLEELTEFGYYLTDVTWNVEKYEKAQCLYRYRVNLELTNEVSHDAIVVALDCYRISEKFVYIPGTKEIYGDNIETEVLQTLEKLYE